MIEDRIQELIAGAIDSCVKDGAFSCAIDFDIEVAPPKAEAHGDFATNAALIIASRVSKKPRDVAEEIAKRIPTDTAEIKKISVAGPGFINFTVDHEFYLRSLHQIYKAGTDFGRVDIGRSDKLQVEFVSANPTGPLHIGHGRGAVYGDVLANIMSFAGYDVTKEYYVNDTGGQMKTLGRSVYTRMMQRGDKSIEFPEECYKGSYIKDIAREVARLHGDELKEMSEVDAIEFCGEYAGAKILEDIKRDLAETGVVHDIYFFENKLHTDAAVENSMQFLKRKGHLYEQDGALWFDSKNFGDDKDRVLKKADGALTYFAADIAYHKNKYERGFKRVIDVWGADHGGYVARMKAAVAALGFDPDSFDAVLIQLVNLMRDGKLVSMSTRSATYETLEDVRKEVGKDACRYFFLMRSHNAQLDFDLELAKRETPDNPVFYIQYAHARICSIFRKAAEIGFAVPTSDDVDVLLLTLPEEAKLARMACSLPKIITECADELEPHKLAFYLLELARMFQSYYSQGKRDERYRVLGGEEKVIAAKLYLLKNLQIVIQNSLRILGISAPEAMARQEDLDV
jgi:arginyl-tRNA synthetase